MVDENTVMAVIRASRPSFRNAADKVAFSVHASFIAAGFVLHAAGPPAFSDNALSHPCTDEVGIENWDQLDDDYAFLYTNPKNSMKVLVKCLRMNDKLLVDALSEDSSEPIHLEINIGDYVRNDGNGNYALQYKNFEQLVKKIDTEILCKIIGAQTESPSTKPSSSRMRDVEVTDPEIERPQLYSPGFVYPPVNPHDGSDLLPGSGAGMYPSRGDFGIGSGGLFVGPNHPLFRGTGRGIDPGFPRGLQGVPPGARFDPIGPPGVPGFEPNRFIRDPRRPGSGPHHPDLEHFRDDSDFL